MSSTYIFPKMIADTYFIIESRHLYNSIDKYKLETPVQSTILSKEMTEISEISSGDKMNEMLRIY